MYHRTWPELTFLTVTEQRSTETCVLLELIVKAYLQLLEKNLVLISLCCESRSGFLGNASSTPSLNVTHFEILCSGKVLSVSSPSQYTEHRTIFKKGVGGTLSCGLLFNYSNILKW